MPAKPKTSSATSAALQRPAAHVTSSPVSNSSSPSDCAAMPAISPDFKEELLSSLRKEMAAIFKTELQSALSENLTSIKTELQAVKSELTCTITNIQAKVSTLESTVVEMETSLSTCSDNITSLQSKVEHLSAELLRVDNKCEDLEARSRRNNIRIIGVPEDATNPSMMSAVSTLLKEAFQLDKDPILDRAHRTLQAKPKSGERPRPIIARLHYHTDCADILRRARAQHRKKVGDMAIHTVSFLTIPRRFPVLVPLSMMSAASSVRYRGYDMAFSIQLASVSHMMVPRGSSYHRMTPAHTLRH